MALHSVTWPRPRRCGQAAHLDQTVWVWEEGGAELGAGFRAWVSNSGPGIAFCLCRRL